MCGPCVETTPLIDQLAKKYAGKCVFGKLNVEVVRELVQRKFDINAVPVLLFFKNGKLVDRINDYYPDKTPSIIRQTINRNL